jgi:hypothetical protein
MSAIYNFDQWYAGLTEDEKTSLLNHIITKKLSFITEGFFSGPSGMKVERGLFSGPAGQLVSTVCQYCGKQIN